MSASKSSPGEESPFPAQLRRFGLERFGTMKGLADALEMKPQALQGYLNGARNPGRTMMHKLQALGFDVFASGLLGNSPVESGGGALAADSTPFLPADLADVLELTARTPDSLARQVGAAAHEVEEWVAGRSVPNFKQLAAILHLVLPIALASRASNNPQSGGREGRSLRPTGT